MCLRASNHVTMLFRDKGSCKDQKPDNVYLRGHKENFGLSMPQYKNGFGYVFTHISTLIERCFALLANPFQPHGLHSRNARALDTYITLIDRDVVQMKDTDCLRVVLPPLGENSEAHQVSML